MSVESFHCLYISVLGFPPPPQLTEFLSQTYISMTDERFTSPCLSGGGLLLEWGGVSHESQLTVLNGSCMATQWCRNGASLLPGLDLLVWWADVCVCQALSSYEVSVWAENGTKADGLFDWIFVRHIHRLKKKKRPHSNLANFLHATQSKRINN